MIEQFLFNTPNKKFINNKNRLFYDFYSFITIHEGASCGLQPVTPGLSSPSRRLYEPEAGFRTKSLRTCSGSLTPRVRCATRVSATYRFAFPTKSQGRQPETGDFGAQ